MTARIALIVIVFLASLICVLGFVYSAVIIQSTSWCSKIVEETLPKDAYLAFDEELSRYVIV